MYHEYLLHHFLQGIDPVVERAASQLSCITLWLRGCDMLLANQVRAMRLTGWPSWCTRSICMTNTISMHTADSIHQECTSPPEIPKRHM